MVWEFSVMANNSQPKLTQILGREAAATPVGIPPRLRPPLTFGSAAVAWRLILYLDTEANQSLGVEVRGQVAIGRSDPDAEYTPGIDLGPFGAHDAGVSRRHAVLFAAEGNLYIRDIGSTNGTRINGFDLAPNQAYRLREGDRLEFGHLIFRFHIVSGPG
jgi:hypothetical protein